MPLAAEQGGDLGLGQAVQLGQGAEHQRPPLRAAHAPGEPRPRPQHLIDPLGDGAPIGRAGEAVRLAPGLQHLVGRGGRAGDLVQNLYDGRKARGGRHAGPSSRTTISTSPATATMKASGRSPIPNA